MIARQTTQIQALERFCFCPFGCIGSWSAAVDPVLRIGFR